MNERALRLDFFVALAALVISALTAAALLYQTRIIAHQYAATIWPYVSFTTTYDPNGETIEAVNDGLGPALIRSAQLSVDGKNVSSWNDYLQAIAREPDIRKIFLRSRQSLRSGRVQMRISMGSIGPSTTIRGGGSATLLKLSFNDLVSTKAMQELLRHRLAIDTCYCSLNGTCWMIHSAPGQADELEPQVVSHCEGSAAINSNAASPTSPPVR